MSSTSPLPRDNRTSLPPARAYAVPGGPSADRAGSINVSTLAEIVRGSDADAVR